LYLAVPRKWLEASRSMRKILRLSRPYLRNCREKRKNP
jgi:hypothetical protein